MAAAIALVVDTVQRLLQPQPIAYLEAIGVAVLGLVVNLLSALWLANAGTAHDRYHGHVHAGSVHRHGVAHDARDADDHGDHNFNAAYVHVLTDALTSLLAIGALAGGPWLGYGWLDAAAAMVGAGVIAKWSWNLLHASAASLVDAHGHPGLASRVRDAIESDGDAKLSDLHVWQLELGTGLPR